jgi:hypothetical protein
MSTTFVPRAPSVLARAAAEREQVRRANGPTQTSVGRSFQVLQNSRAPAQLSLFLRPGAVDVK